MMTNVDHEGRIFLSHPHKNNGFFSCSPFNTSFILDILEQRLSEYPKYAEMRHGDVILTLQSRHGSMYGQHAAVFIFS